MAPGSGSGLAYIDGWSPDASRLGSAGSPGEYEAVWHAQIRRLLAAGEAVERTATSPVAVVRGLVDLHVEFALSEPELILIDDRVRTHLPAAALDRMRRTQRRYVAIWVEALGRAVPAATLSSTGSGPMPCSA